MTDEIQGAGLGLALVQTVVERGTAGTVEVDSVEARGTTVTVRLPLRLREPAEPAARVVNVMTRQRSSLVAAARSDPAGPLAAESSRTPAPYTSSERTP